MPEKKGFGSRWIGSMPKVGIRPTIDGRMNGVRESLESQTMGLATAVAKFISNNLHYPDGSPVECIIADSTIGGVTESALCAEKFAREGVGVSLTVTPCWCYGSETMDMDPFMPKAVWGFNGTERPGAGRGQARPAGRWRGTGRYGRVPARSGRHAAAGYSSAAR